MIIFIELTHSTGEKFAINPETFFKIFPVGDYYQITFWNPSFPSIMVRENLAKIRALIQEQMIIANNYNNYSIH